jgi:cell wall-associated NlpC family hydrolase
VRVLAVAILAGSLVVFIGGTGRAEAAPQGAGGTVYEVRAGDTLWSIARRHGMRPEELAAANGIPVDGVLPIGRRLAIPVAGASPTPRAASPAPTAPRPTLTTYRVRAGDTLWSIARRHGTTPQRLAALNGLPVDGVLAIDRVLKVPGHQAATRPPIRSAARAAAGPPPAEVLAAQRARLAALPARGEPWMSDLLALSRRYLGVRYRWGGTTPQGFDCSGFLYYVFGRLGVTLPRTTFAMFAEGVPVPREDLQSGDIVFFETISPGPSHAGIYLGDGRFIHASSGAGRVLITSMDDGYYAPRYLGARRF